MGRMNGATAQSGVRSFFRRTWAAISLAFIRQDSRAVMGAVTLGYLLAFLWVIGDLTVRPGVGTSILVVEEPLSRMLERTGPASFEAIALVDLWAIRALISPLNVGLGTLLAGLVGVNLALSYLAVVQPKSCGIGAGSGALASLPALLSGTVCCGPVILIVLGIQASGLLLSLFFWLLPIGLLLLLASLVSVAGKIDLTASEVSA